MKERKKGAKRRLPSSSLATHDDSGLQAMSGGPARPKREREQRASKLAASLEQRKEEEKRNTLPWLVEDQTCDGERAAEATRLATAAWAEARREDAASKSWRQTEQGVGKQSAARSAA